jgi:hypothetical protein
MEECRWSGLLPAGLALASASRAECSPAFQVIPVGGLTCGGLDAEHPIEAELAYVRAFPQALGTYRPEPLRQHGYLTTRTASPPPDSREGKPKTCGLDEDGGSCWPGSASLLDRRSLALRSQSAQQVCAESDDAKDDGTRQDTG